MLDALVTQAIHAKVQALHAAAQLNPPLARDVQIAL